MYCACFCPGKARYFLVCLIVVVYIYIYSSFPFVKSFILTKIDHANMQVGRVTIDLAKSLGELLAAGIMEVQGLCVDAPAKINLADQCLLQVFL